MGKWEMVKLVTICDLNMGQSPESSSYNQDGDGIPFYQGNADFGELYPETRYFCNKPTKIANKDDILLSVRAPIGALNIATETCCIGRGLAALTAQENLTDTKYLYYVLKQKNAELNQKGTGSTFKAINKQNLSDVLCPIPPLKTQKKIAKTLDTAAELLAMRKRQLAELDNLIKCTFYDMFGDPFENPKKWEVKTLGNIAESFIGLTYKPEEVAETGTVVLRSGNIQNDSLDFNNVIRVNKVIKNKLKVKQGDILMCSRNGSKRLVGKTALIQELEEEMTFGAFMTIIRSEYNVYLLAFFRTNAFRNQLFNSETTTINQITLSMLDKIVVSLPPLELQTQFAEIVSKIEGQKALVKKAICETQHLFDSLICEYFD